MKMDQLLGVPVIHKTKLKRVDISSASGQFELLRS